MEGQSLFPVVLLAPGSARLAGSQRGTDGDLLGEPKRPHLSQHYITFFPCRPFQCSTRAGIAGCAGSALSREFVSAVGLIGGGSACAAHELGPEGNSKVNPGGWKSPVWTLVLEERL